MESISQFLFDVGPFHWLALAALLIAIEMIMPTQYLIWPGVAAAMVGLAGFLMDISLPVEIGLFAVLSAGLVAVSNRYLPKGVPLLKRVLGVSGQTVCRIGRTITVDGIEMGAALERDRIGRDLPVWQGCRRIPAGEVFLMNWQVRDSLDGRYFGPLPASAVIGRATPLYTDEDGDSRFVWRAPTR